MQTVVRHARKKRPRVADYFQAHLALMMALFNLLTGWFGLAANEEGFVPLSIAEFSL